MPPVLHVENLNISYRVDRQWISAVRDFRIEIEAGQIYGLVGESGSGKSTVSNAIMRAMPPNARIEPGSLIQFQGENLCAKTPRQMRPIWGTRLKLVPQNPGAALNPSIKVGEQVAESARWYMGMNRYDARQKTYEMFRRVQLADPENVFERYPHQLSGGMQQRVVIAMALLTSPELMILDEPTTGLDVTTEATILDLIRELIADFGAGALYVTHNLGVVAQICERLIVMYAGEIMADSPVSDLYGHPVHPYTVGLLNSIPKPGQTKADTILPAIEGHPPSLHEVPHGCVFAPRCPLVLELCRQQKPALERLAEDRYVRCHRWYEIIAGEVMALPPTLNPSPNAEGGTLRPLPSAVQEPHPLPPPPTGGGDSGVGFDRENLLRVQNITKHYAVAPDIADMIQRRTPPAIRAVDGINLSIQKGRTLGLVGESGSGKTTLSRLIMGLVEPTAGTIHLMEMEIKGSVRERDRSTLARLQMVFQNPQNALNPYLTVGQAIRRPLMKLAGLSRPAADQEVKRLLEAVNLRAEYADRYPGQLSGGEKQRVVIARAFASNPDLVICDEPVSALDVSVQAAVLNLLARLQREHDTSYLFISHDLAVVGYLADYVAVMYLGQLFEVGYARDMFTPPLHPYTEALISAIPVPDPNQKTHAIRLHDSIPSARNLPTGCRFHTRCAHKIGAICEQQEPPWQDDGDGHFIRCHRTLDELTALQGGTL